MPWIALFIVFAIGAAAVQAAIRAIWAGDVQLAIAALAFIAIVAFAVLRRATKKR